MTWHVNEFWMVRPQYGVHPLFRCRRQVPWWARYDCCIENRYTGYGLTMKGALKRAERRAQDKP